jgi:hypothetical protein
MQHAVYFQTVPLGDPAVEAFFERAHSEFLIGAIGFGGVRGVEFGGEFLLARLADSAAERERLAGWLRAQPEVVDAYPTAAVGRMWP